MTQRLEPRYMITYHFPNGDADQHEWEWTPAVIGNGFVDSDGRRYRIVDVWIVHEKHGGVEYGVHAILKAAGDDDQHLRALAPDYYTD